MRSPTSLIAVAVLSGGVAALLTWLSVGHFVPAESAAKVEKQPLYWVAPMDPNYRRDKPGKSPMGMDLIPVYADDEAGEGAGVVRIAPEVEHNLGVRVVAVEKRVLQPHIRTVGHVQYNEDKLLHIHPRVEGWVETLYVKAAGNPVKKGQPLYALYSPQLVNAQEEFLQALNGNSEKLIHAAEERLRALHLSDPFIAELKKTRRVSQRVTFYALRSGVVDNLNIREGFYVQPGTTLMSIGSLDEVWVQAEVFERQSAFVQVGMPVTMHLDFLPSREWQGSVDYVYPTLNPETRTLGLRLRFNNDEGLLRPNMFAHITLHAPAAAPVLTVPNTALIRLAEGARVVLAMGQGKFKSVAVRVGRTDGAYSEVLEGLSEGDSVVVSAQFLLDSESSKSSDFMRMTPRDSAASGNSPMAVWVEATVAAPPTEQGTVSLRHAPVPEWQWPAMRMDFSLASSVSPDAFAAGAQLRVLIERRGKDYWIGDVAPLAVETSPVAPAPASHDHKH